MSEELEIHPSHMPEPSDKKILADQSPVICMRCCYFVKNKVVTPKGAAECKPVKIGLRDVPTFKEQILQRKVEAIFFPALGKESLGHIHWAWKS